SSMAVKKPVKKRDATSPNTALVLFLVFFVLLSIGLGVWGYYGYAGQKTLKEEAVNKQKDKDAAQLGERYANAILDEVLTAQGHDIGERAKTRDTAREDIDKNIDALIAAEKEKKGAVAWEGPFKDEKTFELMIKAIRDTSADLGYDKNTKRYATTYRNRFAALKKENDELSGKLMVAQKELKGANDKYVELGRKADKFHEKMSGDIEKAAAEQRKLASAQPEKMDEALKMIKKTQKEKEDMEEALNQKIVKLEAQVKQMRDQYNDLKEKAATGSPALVAAAKAMADPHALLLDISTARPLWDEPLGKIIRVDLREHQVYINLGSAKGVKPQLTFNVFGPGWYGRAEKGMKGTIEVLRVLDANSSLCR